MLERKLTDVEDDTTAYDVCDLFRLLGLLVRNFRLECHVVLHSGRYVPQGVSA